MTQSTPAVTVEPKGWSVEVGGEKIGSVAMMDADRWLALYGLFSTNIGVFESKDEAVAAVLAYTAPKVCPTCHQVVA